MADRAVADRRRRPRRAVAALAALAALAVLPACSSGSDLAGPAAPVGTGGVEAPAAVYVAIGGVETLNGSRNDIQDNWPQIVFAEKLPAGTVYVNLATDGATARSALQDQLPRAQALHPTVATVWVESADVRAGVAAGVYRDQLTRIVQGLQTAGAQRVLLLTPSRTQPDQGGGLADSVAQVAQQTGAVVVDLGDTSDRQDDAGQRRIADAVMGSMG